jgi:hypothetical protein
MERFLFRLVQAGYAEALLLKGALLLRAWGIPSARSTMDIDMMGRKPLSADSLAAIAGDAMGMIWTMAFRSIQTVSSLMQSTGMVNTKAGVCGSEPACCS